MPQYRGLVRTLHKIVTVTSVSVTGLRSSRTRANKLVSIVSRFFWLVLSNLISLSRSWERKSKKHLSLHSSLDRSRERWVAHRAVACVASVSVWFRNKKRTRNDEELDFQFWPGEKWDESQKWKRGEGKFPSFLPHPLAALLLATFFARSFDTRSLFFAPKRHGNACYADYRGRGWRRLVSGSEGLWFITSLREVWVVRHDLI